MYASCRQLVNGVPLGGEFGFILRHDISLIQNLVMVEIPGMVEKLPYCFLYLFQGKCEQVMVVGFELYPSFWSKNLVITGEEFF